ncbi:MAG: amino acid permease [Tannerella sp.]|jgi:APA family basic amino acid/polyamine antiporter|nr:amino acid permease [Tannerella sp.]
MQSNNLERKLGLFPVVNIVVANVIGAGIFTTTGYLMGYLGSAWIMLFLWVIGGLIAFCGALSYGELGANYPEAGGEYTFISKLFHPLPGFLSGWLSLIVGFSAPIAASAIGFSKYFIWAFPQIQVINPDVLSKILAILIILTFTCIHYRGIILGAKIQNCLTILKVVLVVGLIIAGFTIGQGSFDNLSGNSIFSGGFTGWKSIGLSLLFVMFAYSGWNSATYIGSEIKNPAKIIPRSLLISTGIIVVLYFLLNLFFVYAIPPDKMINEPEIGGLAAGLAFGKTAEAVISLLISFALFSSLSANIIIGPRVYYSMAKQGYFFQFAGKIHSRFGVPSASVLLQGSLAIIMVLSGTFEQILIYMGFSLGIFPIIAVLGVLKIRRSGKSVLKMPGYPYVQLIFIFASLVMLVLAYLERPVESLIAILTALSGVPFYFWFKRKKRIP